MAKAAATVGDVSATPGQKLFEGASSGAWTAGSITNTSYAKLKDAGTNVLSGASCTFTFAGSSGNTAVSGMSTVTLSAKPTKLMHSQGGVLVDGDSATDAY